MSLQKTETVPKTCLRSLDIEKIRTLEIMGNGRIYDPAVLRESMGARMLPPRHGVVVAPALRLQAEAGEGFLVGERCGMRQKGHLHLG